MSETRRLAAILALDVVGYSRLMGADEAGTARAVREHREEARPIVARFGGRIVKTMGDGMLLEFPSVVAAVECALAIQQQRNECDSETPETRRIVYRIGVNLGDVLIEADDILGDGVNIAARLEAICEPGGVLISGSAFDQVEGKIDASFLDLGEQTLKNIARPVRAYRVKKADDVSEPKPPTARPPLPAKPSIAVLAFQNMSGDAEQEYFADGMVDDIITGLSRIKWLFVIARNSSFVYKGRAVDVRQAGRELGVRYVLEGGVRKSGARVRINAQLLEAETGAHLWADKFDGGLDDVFDLQDQITDRVVGIVEPSVRQSEIERSRRKRPENLDAHDLYLRALPHVTSMKPDDVNAGAALLERALALDPDYAAAHALLARCLEIRFMQQGFADADRTAALRHADAAIAGGADDAAALGFAAVVISQLGRNNEAASNAIRRALSLNPSCAAAHYMAAQIHSFSGDGAAATTHAHRALRLSPFDPMAYLAHAALGVVAMQEARYDDAASSYAKAAQTSSGYGPLYMGQAAALALAGRLEEARAIARRGLELDPGFRVRTLREFGMLPAIADRYAEGGRLSGLPE
jgi:adenylate cyclase